MCDMEKLHEDNTEGSNEDTQESTGHDSISVYFKARQNYVVVLLSKEEGGNDWEGHEEGFWGAGNVYFRPGGYWHGCVCFAVIHWSVHLWRGHTFTCVLYISFKGKSKKDLGDVFN